jgi:hypothetical protein
VTTYFKAQQGLARMEYTEFLADSTSASIAQLEGAVNAGKAKLDATLRLTKQALNHKGESVVEAINSRLKTTPPTPAPITPLLTSLGTRVENATPVGTSRVAYGNIPRPSTPYTPSPSAPTPLESRIVDATGDGTHHGGTHPDHLDSPQHGGAPPHDPSTPRFTLAASHVRFEDDSVHLGGAQDDYIRPSRYSGTHDGSPRPSPTGYTLRAMSYDAYPPCSESSNDYHCGQLGQDAEFPLCKDFLYRIGFEDASVYSKIIRVHRIIRSSWHNLHYNSYGPQPETILKSNAFSMRLLLKKFVAPSVVAWYERLTSTCKGFRIALIPFDAIQF